MILETKQSTVSESESSKVTPPSILISLLVFLQGDVEVEGVVSLVEGNSCSDKQVHTKAGRQVGQVSRK